MGGAGFSLRLCLALFVFCLLIPAAKGEAAAYSVEGKKFVFVGDSYATVRKGVKKPWPEIFMEILGIEEDQVYFARHGGYGFVKKDQTFAQLIADLKKDKSVTDVIVIGGIGNDWRYSVSALKRGIRDFDTMVRKRFPNARIIYGYCNWNTENKEVQEAILSHGSIYKKTALACGWVYLSGMERMLRQHASYFQADCHHPTQQTQYLIGRKIAELYKKYCVRKIRLNKTELTLGDKESVKLKAVIYPSTAQNKNVIWESSDEDVARVSKSGVVSSVGRGSCIISVRSEDGGFTAECVVAVKSRRAAEQFSIEPAEYQKLDG